MRTSQILSLFILLCTGPAFAEIIHVPSEQPTIQDGINAADNFDTVLVAPGNYIQNISFNGKNIIVGSLFLTSGDTSYISATVIDGNHGDPAVTIIGGDPPGSQLSGFTIRNGLAETGGGILCDETNTSLKNLIIRNNTCFYDGGGIAITGSSLTIEDVIIEANLAEVGAGIFCAKSDLVLRNVIVNRNSSVREGGGLQVHRSDLQMDSCTISNNQALNGHGGGMGYINDEGDQEHFEISVRNTAFVSNKSTQRGAGMMVVKYEPDLSSVTIVIDKCEFLNNIADRYSGLVIGGEAFNCTLSNSRFIGNEASQYTAGAGFYDRCSGEVSNCLFAFNSAATAGGYWNSGGVVVWSRAQVDFINCTFVENRAAYGSGLTVGYEAVSAATNCIFWGNTTDQIALGQWENTGGTLTVSYCEVEGGMDNVNNVDDLSTLIWGEGNIDDNPLFVDAENGDFHLSDYSYGIGSGTLTGAPSTDLDGNPRPNPAESNPDMGAYENSLDTQIMEANIMVFVDTLDFAQVYIGFPDSLPLEVKNLGTLDLQITDIITDPQEYTVSPASLLIPPFEKDYMNVIFQPQSVQLYSGSLTIVSNDPDSDSLLIVLRGEGINPPDIIIDTDSLQEDLAAGQTSGQSLRIGNDGLGKLDFHINSGIEHYALQFDGVNYNVQLPLAALNNLPAGSVEFWANISAFDRDILYKETYNAETISGIRINSDATVQGSHHNFWSAEDVVSDTTLSANEWYHIAWTWDGENQKIYINGVLHGTQSCTDGVADDPGSWLRLGMGDSYFEGILDEVRFWNVARSETDIRLNMYRELSGSEKDLIGYWKFDEGSDYIIHDQTANNFTGYLNNDGAWIPSTAPVNQWLFIDPDSGLLSTGSLMDIDISFDATHLIGGNYHTAIMIRSNDPDESLIHIPVYLHVTGVPNITLADTALNFGDTFIGFPKTDSIAVSNTGTDLLTITDISSNNQVFTVDTTGFDLYVGQNLQIPVTFNPDTVGSYTGSLTLSSNDPDDPSVKLAVRGDGILAPELSVIPDSLCFKCATGDTIKEGFMVYNLGKSGLNFEITVDYAQVSGAGGYALYFDGSDDIVRIYEQDIFDLTSNLTIEAWINPFSVDGPRVIVAKWNDYGPDFSYIFKIWNDSDKPSIELSEYNNYGDLAFLEGNTSVPVNEWTHLAVTYNSEEVTLYYNGIEDKSINVSGYIRNSAVDLIIGANSYYDYFIENFYGLIDEVRIWEVARTQEEIQTGMYHELAGDESGLIGYWPFNEGSGNSTLDETMKGNDGLLQNGTEWSESAAPVYPDPDWCLLDLRSGTLAAGDSLEIMVTIDARDMEEGDKKANLVISSNDPLRSTIRIPVQLIVESSALEEADNLITPKIFSLEQNYPNPFNPLTLIEYQLPKSSEVELTVFNILGQKIETLVSEKQPAGYYKVEFDGRQLASGIYIYKIEAGHFEDAKKMVLLR